MAEFLEFLNKNSGVLNIIFTAVVTISTAVYAVLTWVLVKETRLMRQVQTEPRIEITVQPLEIAINFLRLHIKNIGSGPALNVKFTPRIISGEDAATGLIKEFCETNFFKIGLSYFGPGQERLSGYTQMTQDYESKMKCVIAFDLEYESVTGNKYKDVATIDMSEHKGSYQLGKPHLYSIALSMEKLQKDVGSLVGYGGRLNVNTYNDEERALEEAKRKEQLNKMMGK